MNTKFNLHPKMWTHDGPAIHPDQPVMRFEIQGLPSGQFATITNTQASMKPAIWKVEHSKNGVAKEWAFEYSTAEEALAAFEKEQVNAKTVSD